MTIAEEVGLGQRHAIVEPRAGLAERHADRLGLDDGQKLAAQRLGRVGGDDLDRFEQRQARLDAADDDVDSVGQRLQELGFAAILQKAQPPARQTEAAGKGEAGGAEQAAADEQGGCEQHARHDGGDDPEFLRRPVEAGLRQANTERYALLLLAPRLEILERGLDLLATRALRLLGRAGRGHLGARDRGAAALRLPFPGQHWIEEDPGEAADGGGSEEGEGEDLHVHGRADFLTSGAPLLRRRVPRQGASLRRNSGRVPRTSGGRCRSSDAGR
ncbi:hypothetical protein ACVWW4_004391 [Bradyrhizobium sp. LB7.1]